MWYSRAMLDKPKTKQDDPEQSKRFIEAAKQAQADESEEGAERAFKRAVSAIKKLVPERPRRS
jgi:hypothetical protein